MEFVRPYNDIWFVFGWIIFRGGAKSKKSICHLLTYFGLTVGLKKPMLLNLKVSALRRAKKVECRY